MKKILLVEDEPLARIVNIKLLQQLGYEADIALTGEDAVTMSHKGYDIIFMDIGLPGIDGIEATKRIRAQELISKRHATIIALTAFPIAEYKDKCSQAGLNDIANKPITIENLQKLIEA